MTVKELMATLSTLPADAPVVFTDTYWESEGWGKSAEDPVLWVYDVEIDERGRAHVYGEEVESDEDEDEEEEDE